MWLIDFFLIIEIIPVASAKKITNKTLTISVWYLINSLYLSFILYVVHHFPDVREMVDTGSGFLRSRNKEHVVI